MTCSGKLMTFICNQFSFFGPKPVSLDKYSFFLKEQFLSYLFCSQSVEKNPLFKVLKCH